MIRNGLIITILIAILATSQLAPAQAAANQAPTKTPIQHFVVLLQENHSFDNYFGTYPGADGFPPGLKIPVDPKKPEAGFVEPWHLGNVTITDLSHNAATFREQYNNGEMNGFVAALDRRKQNGRQALGYYNGEDIPYYWNLADHYVLFDRFFSSARDGSFANHFYWIAGAPPVTEQNEDLAAKLTTVPTIFDSLEKAGISWKFYVQNYDPSINYRNLETAGNRASQIIWVPLLNFDRFIDDPNLASHIVDLSQYYVDLRQGTLPAVSYIAPSGASEHPPGSLISGQRFVKTLLQELMRSSAWESSAFLLAYDDWGGWYDHVSPPQVDKYGYGLRVPALLVSPYAKRGYIDGTTLDFTSMLKFIEENWGIAPLAERDRQANNILSAFDFKQAPRQPEFLPFERETVKAASQDPSKVIYTGYGIAFSLSVLAIGLAHFRTRKAKKQKRDEVSK